MARVSPDVFAVTLEQARTLDWTRMRDLLLVAEVLYPASVRHDRFIKRRGYQEARSTGSWTPRSAASRSGLRVTRCLSSSTMP